MYIRNRTAPMRLAHQKYCTFLYTFFNLRLVEIMNVFEFEDLGQEFEWLVAVVLKDFLKAMIRLTLLNFCLEVGLK